VKRGAVWGGAGLVAGVLGLAAWGLLVEPHWLQTRRITAYVPNLPSGWRDQRLALLADFQIGAPLSNTGTVRRAIRRIVRHRPAAVLIAGDFVYDLAADPDARIQEVVHVLRPLREAGLPVFAVLGNHDFAIEGTDREPRPALNNALVAALDALGVRVLRNQAAVIPLASRWPEPLYVVGLGERAVGEDDWRAAFSDLPPNAARIVLTHDPATLRTVPAGWAPLALAGHTHGGQIRVPLAAGWTPARLVQRWPNYLSGWIDGFVQPGNRLYVNRGIGFSYIPVRFGAPPELTLVTLRSSRPGRP
jgi:uncharacterized protein